MRVFRNELREGSGNRNDEAAMDRRHECGSSGESFCYPPLARLVDKLVNALLKDATEETAESQAA